MTEIEPKEYDIIIQKNLDNQGYVKLKTQNIHVLDLIKRVYTFRMLGYQFSNAYRNNGWDGKICLIKQGCLLPVGFLNDLVSNVIPKNNLSAKLEVQYEVQYNQEKINNWVETLKLPFEPRKYQFDAFLDAVQKKHLIIKSLTGSGKSLIIYLIARFLHRLNKRILIICPNVQLVSQLKSDFKTYNYVDCDSEVQVIKAGLEKSFDKPIIISTWQSIYELPKEHFNSVDGIIVDEVHLGTAKCLVDIQHKSTNCTYRIGLSGTIPDQDPLYYNTLIGNFGGVREYLKHQDAVEAGVVSDLQINALFLNYPDSDRLNIFENKKDYQYEVQFIEEHHLRNMMIAKLVAGLEKNTLLLFRKIEHGKQIEQYLKEYSKKKIYYIDGSVKDTIREEIRSEVEQSDGIVLIGTISCLSTGLNIKSICSVVFASSIKSQTQQIQSIGRGLRLLASGDTKILQVFDLVDNLSYYKDGNSYTNYLIGHYQERQTMYKERDYQIVKKTINL